VQDAQRAADSAAATYAAKAAAKKVHLHTSRVHVCAQTRHTTQHGRPSEHRHSQDQTRQDGKSKRRWAVTDESMIVTGGEGRDQNGDVRRCHRHGNCYCLGTGWRRFRLILAGKLFHAAEFGHAAELFTAEFGHAAELFTAKFGHELGHAGEPLVPALVFML